MLTSTKYKSAQQQIQNNKCRNLIQYWKKEKDMKKIMQSGQLMRKKNSSQFAKTLYVFPAKST